MVNLIVSVLFLTAIVCQTTGKTLDYDQLDARMKTFVDLAIIKANKELEPKPGHLNFFASGENYKEVKSYVRIDVRLKATHCSKGTAANEHGHRPGCKFRPKFEAWCMVCSKDPNTSEPYIDCARRKEAPSRYPTWNNICPPHPGRRLPGETHPLSSSLNPGGDAVVVENGNTTGTSLNVTADQENVMKTNASDYEFNYDYEDAVVDTGGDDDTGDITYY